MNKRWGLIALIVFVMVSLMFYFIWAPEWGKKKVIGLNSTTEDVLKEIEDSKNYVNKTAEWMENGSSDLAYFNPPSESKKQEDPKNDVLKYFIAGLMAKDIDILLSSFHPESISKDLFQNNNPNKVEVAEEILKRISRSGKLKEIQYGERKGILNAETNTLTLYITYEDEKKAKIILDIIPLSDAHHEGEEEGVYVITTSAWEIIKQIENSTK